MYSSAREYGDLPTGYRRRQRTSFGPNRT